MIILRTEVELDTSYVPGSRPFPESVSLGNALPFAMDVVGQGPKREGEYLINIFEAIHRLYPT